jgi:hypothetical protein
MSQSEAEKLGTFLHVDDSTTYIGALFDRVLRTPSLLNK